MFADLFVLADSTNFKFIFSNLSFQNLCGAHMKEKEWKFALKKRVVTTSGPKRLRLNDDIFTTVFVFT